MERMLLLADIQDKGRRLDLFISSREGSVSRSMAQKLCLEGLVLVNGRPETKKYPVAPGDQIELTLPEPVLLEALPQKIALSVVYEDDWLIVVDKPKGMVVHPAPGNPDNTLVNALLHHCEGQLSAINGVIRPGIVHRIDKDTSGLLVAAKTDLAHQGLSCQVKAHSFAREYRAVAYGRLRQESGTIDLPIGRHPQDRKKMAALAKNGREAVTRYLLLEQFSGFCYLSLELETGRTHQIRVHLAHLGHPVAGDTVYGPKKAIARLGGQCLHAYRLGFVHPGTGEYLEFISPLPNYFIDFLSALRMDEA